MIREEIDFRPTVADSSREAAADKAISGFCFPLDDEDEAKLGKLMHDSWYNDNALIKISDKLETSIMATFRLAENTKLLKGLMRRDQHINGRSLAPFTAVGWLTPDDVKTIENALFWSGTIRKNRPAALKLPETKNIDRTTPVREVLGIPGSILTVPPSPQRGETWLKTLIGKAEAILPKTRNIEKRIAKRDNVKLLWNATDPNRCMRDKKDPHKHARIPVTQRFSPIFI